MSISDDWKKFEKRYCELAKIPALTESRSLSLFADFLRAKLGKAPLNNAIGSHKHKGAGWKRSQL